jgi:hypothetical protein
MASFEITSNESENNKHLEQCLVELNQNIDNIESLFDKNEKIKISDIFQFLHRLTQRRNDSYCDIFAKYKFEIFLTKLYEYFGPSFGDLESPVVKLKVFSNSSYILNYLVSTSVMFRIEFFKAGGCRALFDIIKNDNFLEKYNNEHYFSTSLGNINWLSRTADAFKNEWRSIDVIDLLLKIARNYPDTRMPTYSAFANLANDHEISTLPDMHVIIPLYTTFLHKTANEMTNGNLKRLRIKFLEDDNDTPEMYDVYFVQIDYSTTHSLTGILLTLYRFSINDKIKYDLYVKYNLKESLSVIIYKGSEIEKKYALKLLAQLSFDVQVNDLIFQNNELKSYITKLSVDTTLQIKSITSICQQILWSIESNHKEANNISSLSNNQMKQVMISYNSSSRGICIQIKEELEKNGYKVWIDINEIHGSSLESMAKAIETSDIILLCITEKYRQSINCQAEAQYAFKLQKHIVPLIMQEGYERVDGWLGMIIGDKIYINFIKYDINEATRRLIHEIGLKFKAENTASSLPKFGKTSVKLLKSIPKPVQEDETQNKKDLIQKWSEKEVKKWFDENKFHEKIFKEMDPCDGDLLFQMHILQIEAPEFFYQSITKDKSVDLKSALIFSKKLKELFNS